MVVKTIALVVCFSRQSNTRFSAFKFLEEQFRHSFHFYRLLLCQFHLRLREQIKNDQFFLGQLFRQSSLSSVFRRLAKDISFAKNAIG
jgi:hypothetical protein